VRTTLEAVEITISGITAQTDLRYLVLALDGLFGPEFVDQIRERNRRIGQRALSASQPPQPNGLGRPTRH
jgi:hypothetical protein